MSDTHEMPEGEEQPPRGTRAMSIVRWGLVAVMALAAAASIATYAGVFEKHGTASGILYFCPMHPSVVQDHPGECPICHMTLVARDTAPGPGGLPDGAGAGAPPAHAVQGLETVELAPERIQLMGMKTAVARREALTPTLRVNGTVTAPESGLAQVQTRVAGWVEKLHVSQTGVTVKRGQVLASIYSPDLLGAQKELLNALEWSQKPAAPAHGGMGAPAPTLDLAEDVRRRLEVLGLTRQDIAAVERSRQPLRSVPVRAPQAGTIAAKPAVEGVYVQPGTTLYEIADLSRVWVVADVYDRDVSRVRAGQAARLTLEAYPGEVFEGTVDFVSPTVDARSRTMRARAVFKNKDGRLKPGMYGAVDVVLPPAEGVVVPREAVVDSGAEQYLFVALAGGRFQPRRVKLGARAGDKVEILEGVADGEAVVTTANFLIDSESRLRSAIQGQGAPAHTGH